MNRVIYMIVTNDRYELPLCVGSLKEVAETSGLKECTVISSERRPFSKICKGVFKGAKIVKTFIDRGEEW